MKAWEVGPLPEVDVDIADGRENLVSVAGEVVLCAGLARTEPKIETRDESDEEPLELKQGETLAGTEGSESDNGVLHLLVTLVELRVDETIVFEDLDSRQTYMYTTRRTVNLRSMSTLTL